MDALLSAGSFAARGEWREFINGSPPIRPVAPSANIAAAPDAKPGTAHNFHIKFYVKILSGGESRGKPGGLPGFDYCLASITSLTRSSWASSCSALGLKRASSALDSMAAWGRSTVLGS